MAAISGAVVVASVLAALLGWVLWYRARALRYDLNRIPGPWGTPVLGNLASVIGSSYVHKVRRATRMLDRNLHCIDETSSCQSEISEVRGLLTHHAGACSVDPPVWISIQVELGWQDPAGHHGP